uniref:hypothetical protein n=1 Tax=Escherichia coli TaxID=562 RepID=UPI002035C753|nr:hypothetical protein [Escherichia coli]
MRKDQIPDFVDEIFATGCPITAVGQDCYVLQRDLLAEDFDRVGEVVDKICQR